MFSTHLHGTILIARKVIAMKSLVVLLLIISLTVGTAPARCQEDQGDGEMPETWDDELFQLTGLPRIAPAYTDRTPLCKKSTPGSSSNDDSGKININTASVKELMMLPRIGEKTAKKIIDYRNAHGGFKSIGEITKVPRIGKGTFDGFKNRITVGSAQRTSARTPARKRPAPVLTRPVNLNTATKSELMQLPWIGSGAAGKIIEYRTMNGRFSTADELLNVPGFTPAILKEIKDLVRNDY